MLQTSSPHPRTTPTASRGGPEIRLGRLRIDPPLFLAPMAGFTNLAFRRIVKRLGCGLTTTEMVMADGIVRDHPKTWALAQLSPEERPAGVQIAGGDPETIGEAARRLVDRGADLIDINMGCPVRKVVDKCAGAAMARDPRKAAAAVAAILRRVDVPVTVKMRTGWDDSGESIATARALEDAGASALAVHGRTREQQYSGRSDLRAIAAVKAAVRIPVIGNGDVVRPEDAVTMLRETGVDGVMIGRAALRDPWIFQGAALAIATGEAPAEPTPEERRAVLFEFFEGTARIHGEHTTVLQMRKFASMYLRGFPGARRLREQIQSMSTRDEFYRAIELVFADGPPTPLVPDHERRAAGSDAAESPPDAA